MSPSYVPPWVRLALVAGPALIAVYFGAQLIAVGAHPGYDATRQVASELGAVGAPNAAAFNAAVMLAGGLAMINAAGQAAAVRMIGRSWVWALVLALPVASFGVATLLAALFPLPDPRHAAGSFLVALCLAYSGPALAVFWRVRAWRWAFVGCLIAIGGAVWVMSGAAGIDRGRWAGAIQRPVALALLTPMALGSLALLGKVRRRQT
ncbi:DUF998 domain-containing protein [Brevundimonas sp.]|jgi:hypothetical membrane protein|uniref:DUF998 domain-containing protein n=1 Tax=Brevundimonas sp. TaxID=1871086 RepID=UPI002E12920E|nr:DUF998 domain-containing protein [Brevundimonas sp.]